MSNEILGLLLYPGNIFCTHEEIFYTLCRCCKFCVMWFWCMDVAILDTEKEITVPLQSPQLGRAHQGWIRGTPQMSLVALLPMHTNYPCILQPLPSKPNPLNGKPPQPVLKQPTPSLKTSLPPNVDQADATGSARRSPATTVVPSNHATPT